MAALDTRPTPPTTTPLRASDRIASPPGATPEYEPASELRWTATMMWLIGLLPAMGLGLLLFDTWLAPVLAGALGVVLLSLIVVPASKLAIARAARRSNAPKL